MLALLRPNPAALRRYLARMQALPCSYAETGATQGEPPVGYRVDRNRIRLGEGEAAFRKASNALRSWEMFRIGWLELFAGDTPPGEGVVVAVLAHKFGVWTINPCRVLYVIDEPRRFGFAYGTLPGHIARGEERFLVEWDDDDAVWYSILAFSRPANLFGWTGYAVMRQSQLQFAKDSKDAMCRAVRAPAASRLSAHSREVG